MTDDYPKSEEAERMLLGQCIMDPAALLEATSTNLEAASFWRKDHGELWELLQSMSANGTPIDLSTVVMAVDRRSRSTGAESCGGVAYVLTTTRDIPSTANVGHYARVVVQDANRRQLLRDIDNTRERARAGLDDPSELVDNLQAALAASEALDAPQRGWRPIGDLLSDAVKHAQAAYDNPERAGGTSTGFDDLDHQMANMHGGDLVVIAARPGMGKTALALNIAENVATAGGVVGVFSLEMGGTQLGMRTIAGPSGVSSKGMRTGRLSGDDLDVVRSASVLLADSLDGLFVEVQAGITVPQIRARCVRLKRQQGALHLVVIDYLQLVKAHTPAGTPREQQVATMSRELKLMAKDLEVPVILLTQLNRDCEKRADKRPIMSDLRESGAIEQDADAAIFIFRPEYYEPDDEEYKGVAEINVAKSRHGGPGVVFMRFDGPATRFYSAAVRDSIALD